MHRMKKKKKPTRSDGVENSHGASAEAIFFLDFDGTKSFHSVPKINTFLSWQKAFFCKKSAFIFECSKVSNYII